MPSPSSFVLAAWAAVMVAVAAPMAVMVAPRAAEGQSSGRAPADSTVVQPIPIVDSTRTLERPIPSIDSTIVLPEIIRNLPETARDTTALPDTLGFLIRADVARKRGDITVGQLLGGRRPVWLEAAPSAPPVYGTPRVLDSGTPVRLDPGALAADRATDRTTMADLTDIPIGSAFVFGAPGLATAWDLPETRGTDAFDYVAVDSAIAPTPFRSAGQLLARPNAVPFSALAMPDPPGPYRVRSALLYRKGANDLLDTAARFSSPLFAHGIAGSYARHAFESLDPLKGSVSTRYYLAAGIFRGNALRSWVEGRLFQMRMELDHPTEAEGAFVEPATPARAEWAGREAAWHTLWDGGGLSAVATLRAAKGQATQIGYDDLGRERWAYPEVGATLRLSGGGARRDTLVAAAGRERGPAWSWSLEGSGSRRRVDYRSDGTSFQPVIRSARATAEIRRASQSGGAAASAAGDFREHDPTLLDARVSLWGARDRARFRLDVESAHERPSYVDLFTPARTETLPSFTAPVVLTRGGDPTLGARRLQGALGVAGLRLRPGVELLAFGSARRLTADFGWDAAREVSGDTIYVVDAARQRGDGWVAHAAVGADAAFGALAVRGIGWVRGGGDGLSPQAGSPPRAGLDASVSLRGTFFEGDLPLELEVLTHASGRRRGLVRDPGAITWDARLHADFGSAGLFATVTNLFDAAVPSGLYRIDLDRGAPLPGRSLSAGVIWYIQD